MTVLQKLAETETKLAFLVPIRNALHLSDVYLAGHFPGEIETGLAGTRRSRWNAATIEIVRQCVLRNCVATCSALYDCRIDLHRIEAADRRFLVGTAVFVISMFRAFIRNHSCLRRAYFAQFRKYFDEEAWEFKEITLHRPKWSRLAKLKREIERSVNLAQQGIVSNANFSRVSPDIFQR